MHTVRSTTHTTAARRPLGLRAQVALAALLAVLTSLVGQGVPGAAATPGASDAATRVVVEARAGLGAVADAITEHGGQLVEVLAPFRMVVADVPATAIDAVEAEAAIGAVSPDVPLQVQSVGGAPDDEPATGPRPVSDPSAGAGVGVVVVDTGIAHHRDLGDRVVARYDHETAPGRAGDRHGHGTFMAGLVAADGPHAGVAPGAHLVSVRVADADGHTSLSTVLEGLVVADMARERHDAPVVLLALSGPRAEVPDPLMVVLEMLWARGSTVVVAAGNSEDGDLASPGWDPFLITAGALDATDDTVPFWSGRGTVTFGDHDWSKPDVVAPGVSVVGLRAPGSTIDREHPTARTDGRYFLGSGTSMAAAHVAGAAAVVLAENAGLSPDQVKGLLMGTADDVDGDADGHGALDVDEAVAAAGEVEEGETGPYEPIGPLPVPDPDVELNPDGWSWDGWSWDGWSWDGWSWDGWSWDGWSWDGWSWDGWSWDGWSWDGWSWDGWSWDGWSWA